VAALDRLLSSQTCACILLWGASFCSFELLLRWKSVVVA